MTSRAVPVVLAVLVLVASGLAGCVGGADVSPRNFELEPNRIGWHVGEEASFTLTLKSTLGRSEPEYNLELPFAIAEIVLEKKGPGFGGNYRTDDGGEVNLKLYQNGTRVDSVNLSNANPDVEVRLRVPADLENAEYTLELDLFQVGWVKSDEFRVSLGWTGE